MSASEHWVVVGLDNGGTSNNATVLDSRGHFLVDRLVENASFVQEGPEVALDALASALDHVLELTGTARSAVRAVGLDTPGPTSADGVVSSKGATNFSAPAWRGFDFRAGLEQRLGLPVVYNNDGNAAALYAHHVFFGARAGQESSVSAIVGTGLGGGIIVAGRVVTGVPAWPASWATCTCRCTACSRTTNRCPSATAGSAATPRASPHSRASRTICCPTGSPATPTTSCTGWDRSGRRPNSCGPTPSESDPMALRILGQQAMALGRLFTIAANFTDPSAYFLGGGVVETTTELRDWFLDEVRANMVLREEQDRLTTIALVPDLDMAGARGSAIAALESIHTDTPVTNPWPVLS